MKTKLIAEPAKHVIIMSHCFNAARELVFRDMIDPRPIPQWWGKRNHTTIVHQIDVKAGGLWRHVERDTQGNESVFHGVNHSITAPERVVDIFEFEGAPGHMVLETLILEAKTGGTTRLTVSSVLQPVTDRDGMLSSGIEKAARVVVPALIMDGGAVFRCCMSRQRRLPKQCPMHSTGRSKVRHTSSR